ncbi:hypothetical protein EAb13_CDS0066 [Acinetobacter phage EAb13]|nr:hypothetical protein EAb13_CDS0066 [Acinetobacter phage EAb13]
MCCVTSRVKGTFWFDSIITHPIFSEAFLTNRMICKG